MSGTAYTKYLKKSLFPDLKFYGIFDSIQSKFPAKNQEAYLLQFSKKLQLVPIYGSGSHLEVDSNYELGEIISLQNDVVLFWNKGEKKIAMKTLPINWTDTSTYQSVYESQDYLLSVKGEYDTVSYSNSLLVCDEHKYVKVFHLKTDNDSKKSLEMVKELYVNDGFTGDSENYCLANQMVYTKFEAFLCQERGNETEDLALSCEPLMTGLDNYEVEDKYPLKSGNWLLFYGPAETDDEEEKKYEVVLLPQYNQPKIQIIAANDAGNYKAEYFFYHNNDYIIYHLQSYSVPDMYIEIYTKNGSIHQKIKVKLL